MGRGEVTEMSVEAGKIIIKTRLLLHDLQKKTYSDWELFQQLNDAARLFAEECARVSDEGGAFTDSATLTIASDAAMLPEYFIKASRAFGANGELLRVFKDTPAAGEYAVRGATLLSGETTVKLKYYRYPDPVSDFDDEIAIPDSMMLPLAKMTAALAAGSDSAAVTAAQYFSGQKVTTTSNNSSSSGEAQQQ
jgi:hypothetical protein